MSKQIKKPPIPAVESDKQTVPEPSLESRVLELEQTLKQREDQLLRTLADFDNYRKRISREVDEIGKAGKRDLLLGLLSVMDSFERAFQSEALKRDSAVYSGFRSIFRQLQQLLEQHQVMSYESIGQAFDPNLHQATGTDVNPGYPEGAVSQEIQKGYLWEGIVLRPAQVLVAKGAPDASPSNLDVWE